MIRKTTKKIKSNNNKKDQQKIGRERKTKEYARSRNRKTPTIKNISPAKFKHSHSLLSHSSKPLVKNNLRPKPNTFPSSLVFIYHIKKHHIQSVIPGKQNRRLNETEKNPATFFLNLRQFLYKTPYISQPSNLFLKTLFGASTIAEKSKPLIRK